MTTLQIILLCLTIPSALWQLLKFVHIGALVAHYGAVRVLPSVYVWFGITLGVEIGFVLAMTGVYS